MKNVVILILVTALLAFGGCANSNTSSVPVTPVQNNQQSQGSPAPIATSENFISDQGYGKTSKKINLFDLGTYSDSGKAVDPWSFYTSIEDVKGYKHENAYGFSCTSGDDNWVRFDLNGKYTTLEGTIYRREPMIGNEDVSWLKFCDGEDFLYTTGKLSENNYTTSFTVDVTGVKYLTIYFCSESSYWNGFIIADPLVISK